MGQTRKSLTLILKKNVVYYKTVYRIKCSLEQEESMEKGRKTSKGWARPYNGVNMK